MKIVHVSDTSIFNYDGISTYINELIDCACGEGHQVLALIPPPLYENIHRQVKHPAEVHVFPNLKALSSEKFVFALPRGMTAILDESRPDLIWIHTIGPLGLAAARLARGRYRVIYTKHCFDGDLWVKHLQVPFGFRWFFRMAAAIIEGWVVGPVDQALYHFDDKKKISNRHLYHKFFFTPPPINCRFATEAFHRNGKVSGPLTIGFCGRLDPEKGLEDIFKAADLHLRSGGADVKLLLIGDGNVGRKQRDCYPHLDVTITGFVDDVIPYLDQVDVFVLASRTETTSLSSLEAFARNIPIFTRRVGFLGTADRKYPDVYTFDTPAELAALIRAKAHVRPQPLLPVPAKLDESLITFAQLHERIASGRG